MLFAWVGVLGALSWLSNGDGAGIGGQTKSPGVLALIENHGQWPTEALLAGRLGPLVVRLEREAIVLQLRQGLGRGVLVRLAFEGASGPTSLDGVQRRPEHYGYFLGNDPSRWQRKVHAFEEALYREIWPGVDLAVRAEDGRLKYDILVAPGASLDQAVFAVSGVEDVGIDAAGSLVLETAASPIVQPPPASFEVLASGERRSVRARYRTLEGLRFGVAVESRDPALPVVIDPGLIWSTYLGSSSVGGVGDAVQAITLGPNGEAIVAGITDWGDFPVTPGAYASPHVLGQKAFVTVFDPSGSSLLYSCIVGGNEALNPYTQARAVGVDASRHVIVAGSTMQSDFPTTPGAFDPVKNASAWSGFVFKLESDGSDLAFSTLLEGSQTDEINALAVTPDGAAIVGGTSYSQDFPVTSGAFDSVHGPGNPGFICRVTSAGDALEWSTFLGGGARVRALALDAQASVFATGSTSSTFPVTIGAFDKFYNDGVDAFAAKISSDGKNLLWGTYLGGQSEDRANAIALDASGGLVVAGATRSLNFPATAGAFQASHHSGSSSFDCFVARLNATGSSLTYSTYLGAIADDEAYGLAVDAAGVATIAGHGGGATFPTTSGAYDQVSATPDAFVARFDPAGKRLFYSSFVGLEGTDVFQALAMDSLGIVTVGGYTTGPYPVTPGSFGPTPFGGQLDGMVTRMDLLPTGAVPYGTSTPSCFGPVVIGVTEMPLAGSSSFSLYASGAPAGSSGLLGLASRALSPGLPIAGMNLLIDPGPGLIVLPATAQATPYAEVNVPIPSGTAGLAAYAQFVFLNTATCGGAGTLSASNALAISVQ